MSQLNDFNKKQTKNIDDKEKFSKLFNALETEFFNITPKSLSKCDLKIKCSKNDTKKIINEIDESSELIKQFIKANINRKNYENQKFDIDLKLKQFKHEMNSKKELINKKKIIKKPSNQQYQEQQQQQQQQKQNRYSGTFKSSLLSRAIRLPSGPSLQSFQLNNKISSKMILISV